MNANGDSLCGCGAEQEPTPEDIKRGVRTYYGALVSEDGDSVQSCGPGSCCAGGSEPSDTMKAALNANYANQIGYTDDELATIPEHAASHSYGCGNPLAFSGVQEGDIVLDLGSGAGLDLLIASKKVGPSGRVIGLDMTPEMIEKAEENIRQAGAVNVEVRFGEMEDMPVEDWSVDWIISNCVISLSPDKEAVFREAYRALKPGGQMLVSDMCVNDVDDHVRDELFQWGDCIGSALDEATYLDKMKNAGFVDVRIVDRKTFAADDVRAFLDDDKRFTPEERARRDSLWLTVDEKVTSVRVYARKAGEGKR